MPHSWPRRDALYSASTVIAFVSGCTALDAGQAERPTATPDEGSTYDCPSYESTDGVVCSLTVDTDTAAV